MSFLGEIGPKNKDSLLKMKFGICPEYADFAGGVNFSCFRNSPFGHI